MSHHPHPWPCGRECGGTVSSAWGIPLGPRLLSMPGKMQPARIPVAQTQARFHGLTEMARRRHGAADRGTPVDRGSDAPAIQLSRELVMRKLTKAAGLLFLAASSVYSDGVLRAAGVNPTKSTNGPTNIRPLDDASVANPNKGAATPSNGFTVAGAGHPAVGLGRQAEHPADRLGPRGEAHQGGRRRGQGRRHRRDPRQRRQPRRSPPHALAAEPEEHRRQQGRPRHRHRQPLRRDRSARPSTRSSMPTATPTARRATSSTSTPPRKSPRSRRQPRSPKTESSASTTRRPPTRRT